MTHKQQKELSSFGGAKLVSMFSLLWFDNSVFFKTCNMKLCMVVQYYNPLWRTADHSPNGGYMFIASICQCPVKSAVLQLCVLFSSSDQWKMLSIKFLCESSWWGLLELELSPADIRLKEDNLLDWWSPVKHGDINMHIHWVGIWRCTVAFCWAAVSFRNTEIVHVFFLLTQAPGWLFGLLHSHKHVHVNVRLFMAQLCKEQFLFNN